MAGEERSEGVHAHVAALAQSVEHPRERDGALPVMVPERLAVGGNRDKFGTIACGEPLDPRGGIAHQGSEGHVVRERTVIEEQGDATAAGGAMPAGAPARRHTLDLVRRQNGEADPLGGQHVERLVVHRRLRQPHPLRLAPEPPAKVGDSPAHFGLLVPSGAERKDRVMVRHRDGVADAIGGEYGRVRLGGVALHPREQRGPEVKAQGPEGRGHRGVAFPLDALVPVVVGRGGRLTGDSAEPRVVARRLVEVAVNDDGPHAS